ncbi:hypothetical protein M408DRAFT_26458, partial [Serendipita vermifera MAFF 305830]
MSSASGDVEVEDGKLEEISLSETTQDFQDAQTNGGDGRTNGHDHDHRQETATYTPQISSPKLPVDSVPISAVKALQSQQVSKRNSTSTLNTTLSTSTTSSRPLPPIQLITPTLKMISASREAKRSPALRDAVAHALELVEAGTTAEKPREIFEPLRLACETGSEKLMVTSLDCISKLVSYAFFVDPDSSSTPNPAAYASPPGSPTASTANGLPTSLADLVTHTITNAYTESTPDPVSLQIVKALLQVVLSPHTLVHHSSLLRAVRTVYNIFLLSPSPVTQNVAQGGLTQMVHHIFGRAAEGDAENAAAGQAQLASSQMPHSAAQSTFSLTTPTTAEQAPGTPFRRDSDLPDGKGEVDEDVAKAAAIQLPADTEDELEEAEERPQTPQAIRNPHIFTTHDLFIKDAFLVFRALCKLTMKPLPPEAERDLKSHPMRSKLLSLHLVLTILSTHMPLFTSPTALIHSSSNGGEATLFVQAVKQYLCLSLSRNAVSAVLQVFEASVEIFWLVLKGMRRSLKREIEVLFSEIFIPILEMRTSTPAQKL